MTNGKTQAGRPLSPHLQVYKPMFTMMMSVAHRLTGAILAIGTLLLAAWLGAAALGPGPFGVVSGFLQSIPGQILLILYSFALIHHMLGGIRHLIWDMGYGFERKHIELLAAATLIGSVTLTALLWIGVYCLRGA
jgi:succinate dehydrogenase / fumarate reductase, cytochrome b subunit